MMMLDPTDDETDREAWRESIRQMPGVIVHRRDPNAPLGLPETTIVVCKPVSIRELLGRDDDDTGDAE